MNVGWKAVTPVRNRASPARRYASASAEKKSTPPKPFTCRSTNPGAATPFPSRPPSPTAEMRPSATSTSPRTSSPRTSAASTPSRLPRVISAHSRGGHRGRDLLERRTRLEIEEVQPAHVDRELDHVARPRGRVVVEPREHRGGLFADR